MRESPLFWPVRLKNNTIFCLDETALPARLVYLKVKGLKPALNLIKTMKTRAFGQVLMVYNIFLLLLKKNKNCNAEKILKIVKQTATLINKTRPTFPFAFFSGMVLGWVKQAGAKDKNVVAFTEKKISEFLCLLREKRIAQARSLSRCIKNGDSILTHCNVSGSLVMAADFCRKQNKKIKFFVSETRPYFQGARLTAWELQRDGFDVTVIPDSSVAHLMAKNLVNLVIVGADQAAQNGDIANKIGTYQIALLAEHFKLPFYVLSPPPSAAKTGRDIRLELRPQKELLEFAGKRIAPKKVKGLYPAFDITPNKLITEHISLELE
jgi:methylthioribose-1-phosphate isomerase